MIPLSSLSEQELQVFFDSFDLLLSDVDGVLWNVLSSIPGTQDAIRSLQALGKRVVFVSNNTTKSIVDFHTSLTTAGFNVDVDDLITPIVTTVYHLKKQNVNGKIFLLGMPCMRQALQNAGLQVLDNGVEIVDSYRGYVQKVVDDDATVSAVVSDIDLNLNYINLQKAFTFLKRPEVVFFKGATDVRLPIDRKTELVGPGVFHKLLEDNSGRKAVPVAKPSQQLGEFLVDKLKITNARRVVFVGDSVPEDMGFGHTCGFQKLLVLSGLTKPEAITNWTFPEEFKPDYYVNSLKDVHEAILRSRK